MCACICNLFHTAEVVSAFVVILENEIGTQHYYLVSVKER